jgi:hypothetical protein
LLKSKKVNWLTVTGAGLLTLGAMGIGSSLIGMPGGIVLAIFSVLTFLAVGWLGALCRETLPKTFDAGKLVRSLSSLSWMRLQGGRLRSKLLWLLSGPAVLMTWIIWMACTTPRNPAPYSPGSETALCMLLVLLAFCVITPGLAIARSSKSTSLAACGLLSVLVQTPLVAGIAAAGLIAFLATIGAQIDGSIGLLPSLFPNANTLDPTWQTAGGAKAFYLFVTAFLTLLLAWAGGVAGGALNRIQTGRN